MEIAIDFNGNLCHLYRRKRSLGQGNIFSSVCQEFCSQEGGLPQCMLEYHTRADIPPPGSIHPPGTRHPLGADTLQEQTPPGTRHPPAQCMPGDTVNKRAMCILLECNLVIV